MKALIDVRVCADILRTYRSKFARDSKLCPSRSSSFSERIHAITDMRRKVEFRCLTPNLYPRRLVLAGIYGRAAEFCVLTIIRCRYLEFVCRYMNAAAPAITGAAFVCSTATNSVLFRILQRNYYRQHNVPCNTSAMHRNAVAVGKFVVKAPKLDLAPRIGIAWDPFEKGRTSILTGYGIYHEQILNGMFLQNIGTNSPYQQNCSITNR